MQRQNFSAHYPASLYDSFSERFLNVYDNWVIRRLMQRFRETSPGAVLLDIGTGTGRLLCKIAHQSFFQQLHIVGLDYFGEMIDIVRQNVNSSGLGRRITILQADVHNLPFSSRRVRFIFSRSTLHHWIDPIKALGEIHRVLEPQGVALIYEINRAANIEAVAKFNEVRRMADVEASRLEEKYTPEEVWQFVKESGLESEAELVVPKMGLMSLGMELNIIKK